MRPRVLVGACLGAVMVTGLAVSSGGPPVGTRAGAAPASLAVSLAAGTQDVSWTAGKRAVVTYCNGQRAQISEPTAAAWPAPAVVYIHGGSWVSGTFDTGGFIIHRLGPALAAHGFVVMTIDYRLGPTAPWPDQIEDATCAVRYLRAHAGALHLDPQDIGTWGQSAGGHLASLLGTAGAAAGWDDGAYAGQSSRVQAVVDMAGPADLLTMTDQGDSGNVQASFVSLLHGVAASKVSAALRAASPVTHVARGDPPFLILHSNNDEIVYPQQSEELAWDLAANGVPVQLVLVRGGGHNFDQAGETPGVSRIMTIIEQFFTVHLHPHH